MINSNLMPGELISIILHELSELVRGHVIFNSHYFKPAIIFFFVHVEEHDCVGKASACVECSAQIVRNER